MLIASYMATYEQSLLRELFGFFFLAELNLCLEFEIGHDTLEVHWLCGMGRKGMSSVGKDGGEVWKVGCSNFRHHAQRFFNPKQLIQKHVLAVCYKYGSMLVQTLVRGRVGFGVSFFYLSLCYCLETGGSHWTRGSS